MEIKDNTYGCDDCSMLKGHHCKLWQIPVNDPHNSHCESFQVKSSKPALCRSSAESATDERIGEWNL